MQLRAVLFFALAALAKCVCISCQAYAARKRAEEIPAGTHELSTVAEKEVLEDAEPVGEAVTKAIYRERAVVKTPRGDPNSCVIYKLQGGLIVATISNKELEVPKIQISIFRDSLKSLDLLKDITSYIRDKYEEMKGGVLDASDVERLQNMRKELCFFLISLLSVDKEQPKSNDLGKEVSMLYEDFKKDCLEKFARLLENALNPVDSAQEEKKRFSLSEDDLEFIWNAVFRCSRTYFIVSSSLENDEQIRVFEPFTDMVANQEPLTDHDPFVNEKVMEEIRSSLSLANVGRNASGLCVLPCSAVVAVPFKLGNPFERNLESVILSKIREDCSNKLEEFKRSHSCIVCECEIVIVLDKVFFIYEIQPEKRDKEHVTELLRDFASILRSITPDENQFERLKRDREEKFNTSGPLSSDEVFSKLSSGVLIHDEFENLLSYDYCLDGVEYEDFRNMISGLTDPKNWMFFFYNDVLPLDTSEETETVSDSDASSNALRED
jgi:hypothetical protein